MMILPNALVRHVRTTANPDARTDMSDNALAVGADAAEHIDLDLEPVE
jgi:hypothetical protein